MATDCFDEKIVLAFLDGTLPGATRAQAEAHLASCGSCADLVTWAAADLAHASRAPGHEGQPFMGQLAPGTRVDRYQILGPIGRGGMGEVYAAYHPDLDRRIALKIVYESSAGSAERRARLLREARTIARLSHPNVIAVYDAGTFGERVYIAMEFVDGDTLDEWRRAAARTWQEILEVFVSTGRGLAAAHAAGIVHRDFKPQNVMVGKDGSVRVMDFGLARLLREGDSEGAFAGEVRDALASDDQLATHRTIRADEGTFLGTPAYMAPEQWRDGPIDARADQFSFCVALHEALYGARPAFAHVRESSRANESASRHGGVPTWLREVVTRGLSTDKRKRYDSMDKLLVAVERGRTRAQRRFAGLAAGIAVAALAVGGWRLSHGRRFECQPPAERLASSWSPDGDSGQRRQAVRAAVLGSGDRQAAIIWQQISSGLDAYMDRWRDMYKETCEATHVRGDQSEEVLDLRMRCLYENLDDVRALTSVLSTANRTVLAQGFSAIGDLAPVARCTDLSALRRTVPLPRDARTLQIVQTLASSFKELRARYDLGDFSPALNRATALRPAVELTGYRPLLADLLELTGEIEIESGDFDDADRTVRQSFSMSVSIGNDLVSARAAAALVWISGFVRAQADESNFWWITSNSFLDHLGSGGERVRAWAMHNRAAALSRTGNPEEARTMLEQAVALKEKLLGQSHPDVARSLVLLGDTLNILGHPRDALEKLDRAVAITVPNTFLRFAALNNRGEALTGLQRYPEAESTLRVALNGFEVDGKIATWALSFPLTALGLLKLAAGDPSSAVPYFEHALRIREAKEGDPELVAEARFGLARALWDSGGNRARALALAKAARATYAITDPRRELEAIEDWLGHHKQMTHPVVTARSERTRGTSSVRSSF